MSQEPNTRPSATHTEVADLSDRLHARINAGGDLREIAREALALIDALASERDEAVNGEADALNDLGYALAKLKEIASLEGREGMTDAAFAKLALEIANAR